jgi:hypothetical protein
MWDAARPIRSTEETFRVPEMHEKKKEKKKKNA